MKGKEITGGGGKGQEEKEGWKWKGKMEERGKGNQERKEKKNGREWNMHRGKRKGKWDDRRGKEGMEVLQE